MCMSPLSLIVAAPAAIPFYDTSAAAALIRDTEIIIYKLRIWRGIRSLDVTFLERRIHLDGGAFHRVLDEDVPVAPPRLLVHPLADVRELGARVVGRHVRQILEVEHVGPVGLLLRTPEHVAGQRLRLARLHLAALDLLADRLAQRRVLDARVAAAQLE